MTAPRVLVVEDEFLIRLTLCEALGDAGFEVVEASSAEEALAAVAGGGFQLLLTDVQLSGNLSGIELARAVRRDIPQMPVIFMTGRPDRVIETEPGARNVTVAKPYQLADICAKARQLTGL